MSQSPSRPPLNSSLNAHEFKQHHWLKVELLDFCHAHGLSVEGNKHQLKNRIVAFLDHQRFAAGIASQDITPAA
ncbi:MAG: SAP domain-containing protein [Phototrophicaceae bacterium]|jgi:hypothetical protein